MNTLKMIYSVPNNLHAMQWRDHLKKESMEFFKDPLLVQEKFMNDLNIIYSIVNNLYDMPIKKAPWKYLLKFLKDFILGPVLNL